VRRAFVVVIDACGAGALDDAADYGDEGADTLAHVAELAGGLDLPALEKLGLGSIKPLAGVAPADDPVVHGRLHALGPGKDTICGHWELMGAVVDVALPTYPDGFPHALLDRLREEWGREVIGNVPADGLEVLEDLGSEHLRTGAVIVYTSADSVLQIAAHEDMVDADELYGMCETARAAADVGRVIARPFAGAPGRFRRLPGRRDYALEPPRSYVDELHDAGVAVHAVGKIHDVFAGRGFTAAHPGADNATALEAVDGLVDTLDTGLVFANLVDTDQVFGHRKDVDGFARALAGIDAAVAGWLERLGPDDLLVLTADHGVDPKSAGWDHTREHVPLLAAFAGHGGRRHDGPMADVGASCLRWLAGREAPLPGEAFL
jgi:phosphopentomutase